MFTNVVFCGKRIRSTDKRAEEVMADIRMAKLYFVISTKSFWQMAMPRYGYRESVKNNSELTVPQLIPCGIYAGPDSILKDR